MVGVLVGMSEPAQMTYNNGRPYTLRQIFLTDSSEQLLMIEIKEHPSIEASRFPFAAMPSAKNVVVSVLNLKYASFDSTLRLHRCTSTDSTDFTCTPKRTSMPQLWNAAHSLSDWAIR